MPPKASPSPSDALDLSITAQLAKIGEGFPATDLIKVLLRHIAIDLAQFVRNAQCSNQVYYRSRLVYDAIQELMKKIDGASDTDTTIIWETFQRYTAAIIPLEKILLNFYSYYRTEQRRQHLPPTDSIESTIIFLETWQIDRKALEDTFVTFSTSAIFFDLSDSIKKDLADNHRIHRTADDMQTLKALYDFFIGVKIVDADIIQSRSQKLVLGVKTSVRAIMTRLSQNPNVLPSTEIAIRILLLVYIPFAYLSVATTSTDWRDYFKTTAIWLALQNATKRVEEHLQPSSTVTVQVLEKEHEDLKLLLLKLTIMTVDTAKELLDLFKLAAQIRSPLRARSVELVKMMYQLNYISSDPKNATAARHRPALKMLFQDSLTTLEGTKAAVSDVKTIVLVSDEYKKQEIALKDVLSDIGIAYSNMGLTDAWADKQTLFNEAVKIDEEHLTLMRRRLSLD
ncbi:hypothetical protein CPC08DRAFT_819932 [Agrocybe pediades]|nr:hypothetical protein CPC08DRAFT_819932 [Agrocybe pediades]